MLFTSLEFALFIPAVFAVYWLLNKKSLRLQNIFLLVVSYFFYGWWDARFLILIFISSLTDFFVGLAIEKQKANKQNRKLLLALSIFVNIGFLGFFKYFNFFAENLRIAFSSIGIELNEVSLNVILPVGISFYTFQTLSYTIDIYRGKMKASRNPVSFFAFVSFFPQLVAGPIERAKNLLPQFQKRRTFSYDQALDGMRQILWGLVKKVVVADNCAIFADIIFANPENYGSASLFLGALFFAFQLYADFSAYSDIAIGLARLFGFNLMQNFRYPFFAVNMADFWRRWHISLTTWFRDYLYIPLGGSFGKKSKLIRNVFIIFLVSGFWHGANWTFIVWGAINALFFIIYLEYRKRKKNHKKIRDNYHLIPSGKMFAAMLKTFLIEMIALTFFRAKDISTAWNYIYRMTIDLSFSAEQFSGFLFDKTVLFMLLFILAEWVQRKRKHTLDFKGLNIPPLVRRAIYLILLFAVFNYAGEQQNFIYFQF